MTSYVPAKKGAAFITYVSLLDYATAGRLKSNPTLSSGDVKVSIDGGAFANLTTLPTVTPASGAAVKVSLSTSEMNGDNILVVFADQTDPPEWNDLAFNIQTATRQIDDLSYDQPVRVATAQAGAVGQITLDASASSVDNFYRGLGCYITSGTGAGQVGIIYGYTGATKVATTSPQWRTSPDSTSVFMLLPTPGANVEMWRTSQANAAVSGRPDVYVGATASGAITNSSFAAGAIDATAIATDAITSAELATSAATKIRDTILSDATTFAGASIAAIKAKTDNLPAAPAATSDIPTANQNADALLDRADGVETGYTFRQWLRLAGAVLLGKASGLATTTAVYRDLGDTKDRITATVDANGNRSAVTKDAS